MESATVAQLTYMGDGPGIVHGGTMPLVQKKPPLEKRSPPRKSCKAVFPIAPGSSSAPPALILFLAFEWAADPATA